MLRSTFVLLVINTVIFGQAAPQSGRIAELSKRDWSVFLIHNIGNGRVSVVRNGQLEPINTIKVSAASASGWIADFDGDPSLSPDAEQVALIVRRPGTKTGSAIVVYNLREHTASQLVDLPYRIVRLAWSPVGGEIAFVAQPERFGVKLYTVSVTTGQVSEIDPEHQVFSASWSPDGKEIAIAETQGSSEGSPSQGGIYVYNRESKVRRKIGEGGWPSWSPDGKLIAYLDQRQENSYVVDPNGKNLKRLFTFRQNRFSRAFGNWNSLMCPLLWSPDARYLLCHREAGDNGHLVKIFLFDLKSRKTEEFSLGGQWIVTDLRAVNR